jgi:hypothetical protein
MATTASARRAKTPTSDDNGHSGRLLLRMPPELHSELAQAAERDGSSLNAYITRILGDSSGRAAPRRPSGGRLLRYAVIADLVLVAVAAIVAVALLIAAWP